FFFSSRRRHTRFSRDWSSDVCSSDLAFALALQLCQLSLAVLVLRPLRQLVDLLLQVGTAGSHACALLDHQLQSPKHIPLQVIIQMLWPAKQELTQQFQIFTTQLPGHITAETVP